MNGFGFQQAQLGSKKWGFKRKGRCVVEFFFLEPVPWDNIFRVCFGSFGFEQSKSIPLYSEFSDSVPGTFSLMRRGFSVFHSMVQICLKTSTYLFFFLGAWQNYILCCSLCFEWIAGFSSSDFFSLLQYLFYGCVETEVFILLPLLAQWRTLQHKWIEWTKSMNSRATYFFRILNICIMGNMFQMILDIPLGNPLWISCTILAVSCLNLS